MAEGEYSQVLIKDVNNFIKGNQRDELLNIKDKGKVIKIFALAKTQKDIEQLFISILQEKEEAIFLQIKGNFSTDMIQQLGKVSHP